MIFLDYVAPIVAYRTWGWDWHSSRPSTLNNEQCRPGKPMAAACTSRAGWGYITNHQKAAHENCTCGIYAFKTQEQLLPCGLVYGEVLRGLLGLIMFVSFVFACFVASMQSLMAQAAPTSVSTDIVIQRDVPMKTRDGVTLYADIYRPSQLRSFL